MVETLSSIRKIIVEEIEKRLSERGVTDTNPTAVIYFFKESQENPYKIRNGNIKELVFEIKKEDFKDGKCKIKIRYIVDRKRLFTSVEISKCNPR